MSQFDKYAPYYEIVYQSKNYKSEIKYILDCISKETGDFGKYLLEFGCGSGGHIPFFLENNFDVSGIDLSNEMLSIAKDKFPDAHFYHGNISDKKLNQTFDLIVSLYHVINYLQSELDLSKTFRNASDHLKSGGLFAFDFWYGPAVLLDHPKNLDKSFSKDNIEVLRNTTPVMDYNKNTVQVNFDFKILIDGVLEHEFNESHLMKYLFFPEIEYHLTQNNFKILQCNSWMTTKPLSEDSWYGFILAKKE
ncbi:MAG: hypothetical protein COA79_20505 [Planctomycetota bacterium]|nr:MAG: hypothetical protein COA79_20505 [Planctomycetota bacterium]